MLTSRLNKRVIIAEVVGDKGWAYFWEACFLPRWLPLLLGLGLGVSLASLIVNEVWYFAIPLALAIPAIALFIRYPFVAVVVWILVFPFFAKGAGAADRYIYWILHRAMILAALGIVIFSDWLKIRKREPVQFARAELAMLIFMGLALANIFLLTQNPLPMIYKFFDHLFVPFCVYWLIRLTAPREKDLKLFLWAVFITVVAQCIIGLLAWFASQVLPSHWLGLAGERTVGTLNNVAVYTSTLIFLSLWLLQYAMNCKSRRLRTVLLFTFGLALFCVFFSFSRGSWLGCSVVLAGLMLIYPKVMVRLTIVLVILVYILSSSVLAEHVAWGLERLTGEASRQSAEGRVVSNNASLGMIEAKPLWGWGYRNYDLYDYQFQTRTEYIAVTHDRTSHNTYLTIMVEMGLVAFFFYMFPVGWWLMLSIKTWRRLPRDSFWSWRLLMMLWLAMTHIFIVSNFMDMIRFHLFGTTIWWMALGFIANMVCPYLRPGDTGDLSWTRQPGGHI